MSGLVRKYGGYPEALSVYNSGQPKAYLDPHFAQGQTFNYVKTILGGRAPSTPTPASAPPASPVLGLGQDSLRSLLAAQLLQGASATLQGQQPDTSGLLALALMRQQLGAAAQTFGSEPTQESLTPEPAPIPGSFHLHGVQFIGASIQGSNPQFVSTVAKAAKAAGATQVKLTSAYRSPKHNRDVQGVSHSNHLFGHALDGQAFIPGRGWVPLGDLPTLAKFGLRSGDQPGFYHGGPDPVHVDDAYNQRV